MTPPIRLALAAVAALCLPLLCLASDRLPAAATRAVPPAQVGTPSGRADTHGWFIAPIDSPKTSPLAQSPANEPERWAIWHLPPRRLTRLADGKAHGSHDGSLRPAGIIRTIPEAVAAAGDELWIVGSPSPGPPDTDAPRPVLSQRAVSTGVADLWRSQPEGRAEIHAMLPPARRVLGLAATPAGPVALLLVSSKPNAQPSLALRRLADEQWLPLDLPLSLPPSSTEVSLLTTPDGFALFQWRSPSDIEIYSATLTPTGVHTWAATTTRLSASIPDGAERPALFFADNDLFSVGIEHDRIALRQWGRDRDRLITTRTPHPGLLAVVPAEGLRRVALAWKDRATTRNASPIHILELSLDSGAVFFDGKATPVGPISLADFRLLLVGLFLLSGAVLLFILGPADDLTLSLPDGYALASTQRRLLAAVIDFLVALLVASRLMGFSIADLLSLEGVLGGPAFWTFLATLATGGLLGTLSERFFGVTVGKLFTSCQVAEQVPGGMQDPSFRASFLRNILKWAVPPIAIFMLTNQNGRHPGDIVARTAVLVRVSGGDNQSEGDQP
jgi:hypothetical protein